MESRKTPSASSDRPRASNALISDVTAESCGVADVDDASVDNVDVDASDASDRPSPRPRPRPMTPTRPTRPPQSLEAPRRTAVSMPFLVSNRPVSPLFETPWTYQDQATRTTPHRSMTTIEQSEDEAWKGAMECGAEPSSRNQKKEGVDISKRLEHRTPYHHTIIPSYHHTTICPPCDAAWVERVGRNGRVDSREIRARFDHGCHRPTTTTTTTAGTGYLLQAEDRSPGSPNPRQAAELASSGGTVRDDSSLDGCDLADQRRSPVAGRRSRFLTRVFSPTYPTRVSHPHVSPSV